VASSGALRVPDITATANDRPNITAAAYAEAVCGGMICALDTRTQLTALGWMLIGFVIYFVYGKSHSKLKDL
jgi:hypothetical protein